MDIIKERYLILLYLIQLENFPGDIVALRPNVPLYLPVIKEVIDKITVKATDQNNNELRSEGDAYHSVFGLSRYKNTQSNMSTK